MKRMAWVCEGLLTGVEHEKDAMDVRSDALAMSSGGQVGFLAITFKWSDTYEKCHLNANRISGY
jgi:hypothetical protein